MADGYDVIVVGARCAGASTAMLLARRGHRVLLLDRATFPSDVPQGHFVYRDGPARLVRWGVLARATAGCPAVTTVTRDDGDFALVGRDLVVDGIPFGYGPRHGAFDAALVEAAVAAGAELREGVSVEDVVTANGGAGGDRVTGVRARARGGAPFVERAALTVGADGRHSRVARAVRAPAYDEAPSATCWYFTYWQDVPMDGLELRLRERRLVIAHPTTGGLAAIFVAWPAEERDRVRADVEGAYLAALDRVPGLAERVRAGRRVERLYGATDLPNYFRRPWGPGWALVGDAGCHKDPYLALGMCDVLRDAEGLADAIDAGLAGRAPLDAALDAHARRRDAAGAETYQLNLRMARFEPEPAPMRRLREALRGNQADTNRFFMATSGMIPREAFFAPDNVARILGAATPPAPAAHPRR